MFVNDPRRDPALKRIGPLYPYARRKRLIWGFESSNMAQWTWCQSRRTALETSQGLLNPTAQKRESSFSEDGTMSVLGRAR